MIGESKPGNAGYEGGAFHPDLEGGRASGTLRLSLGGVHFESEQGDFDLPLEGIRIELGGANDRLLFFSHPIHPQVTVHTADHSILKHPVLAQRPDLLTQVSRVRRKKLTTLAVLLSVLVIFVGGIAGLIFSKDRIVKAVASRVPVQWEVKLGDTLYDQIKLSKHVIEDTNLDAQLAGITGPLVAGIKDSRYPLKFHIIEDPTLNAFAIPGGNVVIHSGLLLAADSPEEVAGVLAHEITHVNQRHSIRAVISSVGLYAVLQAFVGDATSLLAVIASNGAFLLDRKFSRDFEREADDGGWNYLVEANVDPRGMIEFFKKMEAEERKMMEKLPGGGAPTALSFISTHPATEERLHSLEAKWERLPAKAGFRKFELNYAGFKDSLRARLHSAPNPERN